jgi:adenylate cyclase
VQCAQQLQAQFRAYNATKENAEQIHIRIGIHLGDIVQQHGDVQGDGVNVAARLQPLAAPDTICVSQKVYEEVNKKLLLGPVVALGRPKLKNIAQRFPVYLLLLEPPRGLRQTLRVQQLKLKPWQRPGQVALLLVVLLGAGVLGRYAYVPTPAGLPVPDKPSLVVLPFDNMSKDPAQDYFSDGITEDLTTDLSRLSSLFVVARNSAFTYKGKPVKVQEIGTELGVQYVLEGSVRKADKQVRITAQLVDASTGHHLWAERYDRPLDDVFALQTEIVQHIVTTLNLQLTVWEHGVLVRKRTDNLDAYDAFLRGMAIDPRAAYELNKDANLRARHFYEQALALDPRYAEAKAMLGWTYWREWFFQWAPDPGQALEQAGNLARQAIALDETQPLPHRLLAVVYVWMRQHEEARVEAERAIALDPNDPEGYLDLGWIRVFAGQPEEGSELMERAIRLNPHAPAVYFHFLGWAYGMAGHYERAIPLLQHVLSLNPNFVPAHIILAMCYAEADRLEAAHAEAAEIVRVLPQFSLAVWSQKWPYKDRAMLARKLAALRKAGLE